MDGVVFLKGLGLGGGLIVAIGSQNAFLLKQGLRRQCVLMCACICILCDVALIALGVAGMGSLIAGWPGLLLLMKLGGALFLFWYGLRAARAAWRPAALTLTADSVPVSRMAIAGMALAFSLLNPHVYLDTVVLLGAIGGQQPPGTRAQFAAGAMLASVLWFLSLGYGARLLAPVFARPMAWRVLDGFIALVMWSIALSLLI
ncbi:MAG: LysE family transporter [Pseudomonadota bacterium]